MSADDQWPPDPERPRREYSPLAKARAEHLALAKERALAYLPDYGQAMASFISDLGKHEETAGHAVIELLGMHALAGLLNERECRDLIEGTW